MPNRWNAALIAAVALATVAAVPALAGVPDLTNSYYAPEAGSVASPTTGTTAANLFRACPNNDGGVALPGNARLKIVVRDVNNNPIPNVAAADICILLNGGTAAQGFSGVGADSMIANSLWNPTCPDIRCMAADAPTDSMGVAYITLRGADPTVPGVAIPGTPGGSRTRKWGHYDSVIPVYVLGFQLSGRLTSVSANGSYLLRIKNFDWNGGLGATLGAGEVVSSTDFNALAVTIGLNNTISYWKDFNFNGAVDGTDFNLIALHTSHSCTIPYNP